MDVGFRLPAGQIPAGDLPSVGVGDCGSSGLGIQRFQDTLIVPAELEQGTGTAALPEVSPFPATQVRLPLFGTMSVEELPRLPQVVGRQGAVAQQHVRGIGLLPGGQGVGIPALDGVKMGVNYGWNRVRFMSPVKVGDQIRTVGKIKSVEQKGTMLEIVNELTVQIEGQDKPACVADSVLRLVF